MANFTRVRSTGMWTVSVLLGSELEKFDANLFKAPNFAEGGTYAPSSAITIGGSGLALTTTLNGVGASLLGNVTLGIAASSQFIVNAASSLRYNTTIGLSSAYSLTVNAAAYFMATASFGGILTATAWANLSKSVSIGTDASDAFEVIATETHYSDEAHSGVETHGGACTFGTTVAVTGKLSCNGAVDLGNTTADDIRLKGTLTTEGPTTFNAATTFATGVALNAVVTPGTNGYIVKRVVYVGSAGVTISLANYDFARVSASGTLYLADVGSNGSVIRVVNNSGGTVTVKTPGGVTLRPLTVDTWCDFMRESGATYGWFNMGEGTCTAIS